MSWSISTHLAFDLAVFGQSWTFDSGNIATFGYHELVSTNGGGFFTFLMLGM